MYAKFTFSTFTLILGATLFLSGCGQPNILQSDSHSTSASAVVLYKENCLTCHGDNLQGGVGPNLQHIGSQLSLSQIEHRIDVGIGPMPGYGPDNQGILASGQIHMLASWLSSKK